MEILKTILLLLLPAVTFCDSEQVAVTTHHPYQIPLLGFGTWSLDKSNASDVVSDAILVGYRHIDCASAYGNEKEVGKGIADGLRKAGLQRDDIWVTSKLWNNRHKPDEVPKALERTLDDLGVGYLDLYLMHWPVAAVNGGNEINFNETWKAMHRLHVARTRTLRHIGISNFSPSQLEQLMAAVPLAKPYCHQFELHPYLQQSKWVEHHRSLGIHVTAYSPLGNSNPTYQTTRKGEAARRVPPLLENEIMLSIAKRRGCVSAAQVALAWGMARGTSVIPKSAHTDRILENYDTVGKCKLLKRDMRDINIVLAGEYVQRFNNPSESWGVNLFEGLEDMDDELDSSKTEL